MVLVSIGECSGLGFIVAFVEYVGVLMLISWFWVCFVSCLWCGGLFA